VSASTAVRQNLRFKGKSYLALVLTPEEPYEAWIEELADLSARSPGFFATRPVVLDVAATGLPPRDVKALVVALDRIGVRVMGLEGPRHLKLPPGMPPLLNGGRQASGIEVHEEGEDSQPKAAAPTGSLVVENVRSGQSVVFPDGDVTVIGSVASGAEVLAAGSIHIYGTLRGRAVAGAYGNPHARIFCRKLEAEFLAIDAEYLTAEGIDQSILGQPVQIWSENASIKLNVLR
jgi:septum site-determining protein MinC